MDSARPALVIGYGNTLRGDDAVGFRVASTVAGWGWPDVTSLAVPQLTPELAPVLAAARLAVFVDARLRERDDCGDVECQALEPSQSAPRSNSHAADPRRLLALARDVYGFSPRAWLLTVPTVEIGFGEQLSTEASQGLYAALGWIEELLK
jgi:hydrogenase maturation protease